MRVFSYALWIILTVFGVSFALLNSHTFPVNYFIGKSNIYFPLLFLLLLLVGALLGMCALLPVVIRLKTQIHRLKQKMKALDQEVINLRRIPIQDEH